MLDLHSAMEDIAENDHSLLARRYQQRRVTGSMPRGSENPHSGYDILSLLCKFNALLQQPQCIGHARSTRRLIVEAVPFSATYQIACIREGQGRLAVDLAHS